MIIGGEIPKEKRIKRDRKDENSLLNIIFEPEYRQYIWHPHNNALVISAHVQNFLVKILLIDDGIAVNSLSWNAYKAMGGSITNLKAIKSPITSFYGGTTQPMGVAELAIEFGGRKIRDTKTVKSLFNIVDLPLTYNGIIGRPIIYEINAATSIIRLSMKIPLEDQVITILGDQTMAQ